MRRGLLLLFSCASAFGQLYEAKSCLYREGDDPRWAQPDYDDSGWAKVADRFSRDVTPPGPYLWMRCRIVGVPLDPGITLSIQESSLGAKQVFVNGIETGSFGDLITGRHRLDTDQNWPIPPEARGRTLLVAVRIVVRQTPSLVPPTVGSRSQLEWRKGDRLHRTFLSNFIADVTWPMYLALGLTFIILSRGETRNDTLFFGIFLLGQGIFAFEQFLPLIEAPLPADLKIALNALGNIGTAFGGLSFYSLRGRRMPLFYWACFSWWVVVFLARILEIPAPLEVAFRSYTFTLTGLPGFLHLSMAMLLTTALMGAFWPLRSVRKSELPLMAVTVILAVSFEAALTAQLPWIGDRRIVPALRSFQSGAFFPVALCLVITLTLRMRRTAQRQSALQRDMDAAREMQRKLVPERIEEIPGFHIETAYSPAKEVGGDFYQFLPANDGSLLVVVGDVSGKGLDAAMLVAVVIGALGKDDPREPAVVLSRLNGRLIGKTRGGFVTCCCALFRADGTVEIANAGHIPPYLQGRELELAAGPPLGIIEDACYESATLSSGAGAITFFSDGVVEATSGTGELLGFDRLAGLSVKPAREIASEAERWGQEDDITVVQVAYA